MRRPGNYTKNSGGLVRFIDADSIKSRCETSKFGIFLTMKHMIASKQADSDFVSLEWFDKSGAEPYSVSSGRIRGSDLLKESC